MNEHPHAKKNLNPYLTLTPKLSKKKKQKQKAPSAKQENIFVTLD